VVFNEFRSVISQIVRRERLLPISRAQTTLTDAAGAGATPTDYIYEPDPATILAKLLPRHLEFSIFRILLESAAAEHAARMTAMESATRNAGDMIDSLTLTYNRARQARITKELIEIVSGAAAQNE
jgi:F-type H+-transporting ATPase subunit gamma